MADTLLARRSLVAALALGALCVGALGASACLGSTGNERFRFEARLGGAERDTNQAFSFTNARGWTVTLFEAHATVGPLYLNTIAPLYQARAPWSWIVREAHADEQHLGSGLIVGEVLAQLKVDLLSPALVPFPVLGTITGDQVRTAEIYYYPPPGTPAESLDPRVDALTLAGEATQAGQTVAFRGSLTLDSDWLRKGEAGSRDASTILAVRQVRGVPASFVADDGGHLEVRLDAARLLDSADFGQIADNPTDPSDPSVHVLQNNADQVSRSLYEALTASRGTYDVRWVPGG